MVYAFLSAAKWQQLSWSWTTASTTLLDVVCALAASDGVCWTAAATLLDEVYAFFHAARWCAQSWSWTAAANNLLEEVYAFLRGAGAGRLLLLPCWTRSTPSFAAPGGEC